MILQYKYLLQFEFDSFNLHVSLDDLSFCEPVYN